MFKMLKVMDFITDAIITRLGGLAGAGVSWYLTDKLAEKYGPFSPKIRAAF